MYVSKAERKRHVRSQMIKHQTELKLFGISSTTGSRAVIHFAGIKEEFWFREGEEPFRTPNGTLLDLCDEKVLWALARNSCSASKAGYVGNNTRKRRKTVEPQPVHNHIKTRKFEDVEAARATFLYALYENQTSPAHLNLLMVSGEKVVLRANDHEHQLVFSRNTAKLKASIWLSLEWFSFLCCFGEQLLAAALNGYRSTNPPKAAPKPRNPTPLNDPRQARMII